MEVILLEKVENLGGLGDKVAVRSGYARNYLIPGGKAKYATAQNIAEFEARRADLEKAAAESLASAEARAEKLNGLTVEIGAHAGSEGKLFGSVANGEVAEAITAAGVAVEKREVRMPDGAIRAEGEYAITLHLHTDVDAVVTVNVVASEE